MPEDPVALERRETDGDRMLSPSAERNSKPIADVLERLGLVSGKLLEIGCGTGQHAAECLRRFPDLTWLATDADERSVRSCIAWGKAFGVSERLTVGRLDASREGWWTDYSAVDILYSSNVIHIAPVTVLGSIFLSAGHLVRDSGRLVLYGPFSQSGRFSSQSNADFHESLRARNPDWGLRDIDDQIIPLATRQGLALTHCEEMPANNQMLIFSAV